jgi:hypothetical protein
MINHSAKKGEQWERQGKRNGCAQSTAMLFQGEGWKHPQIWGLM